MRVVKNINNNVSLCLDKQGREVIAFGKGIGFIKAPYEIPLDKVQRTFYDINENYLTVIAAIDEEILEISNKIINYAIEKTNNQYDFRTIFTLADHIQFALQREKNHIHIQLPLLYEVQSLYPIEMEIGILSIEMIKKNLNITLPKEEAASIALHLVNYEMDTVTSTYQNKKSLIENCTEIIEEIMNIKINKSSFNYSRFITHMHYLLDRSSKDKNMSTENKRMFQSLQNEYPKTYKCALKIKVALNVSLNDEELLYLILHINRLCAREDCYQ